MRTHWVREEHTGHMHTHCGMEGWLNSGVEYSTVNGDIIDATQNLGKVDCTRCLRSAKRISETCTTNPRGNHRRRPA